MCSSGRVCATLWYSTRPYRVITPIMQRLLWPPWHATCSLTCHITWQQLKSYVTPLMYVLYARVNVTHQGGEEGRPRGILTRKNYRVRFPTQGKIFMSESPGCRAGFSTIFNVRDPEGGWMGTKVGVRIPTPGGFFWSDLPGSPLLPPLGRHIDRCITWHQPAKMLNQFQEEPFLASSSEFGIQFGTWGYCTESSSAQQKVCGLRLFFKTAIHYLNILYISMIKMINAWYIDNYFVTLHGFVCNMISRWLWQW